MHDHDRGLGFDLGRLSSQRLARRAVLGGVGAVGALAALGCGAETDSASASTSSGTSSAAAASSTTTEIPEETAGPYPGDGTNGPDVLDDSGVVRRDIRSSFDGASGTAEGFPLFFSFVLTSTKTRKPLPGVAVYAWHCDRDGSYSMYADGLTEENYLRGVQVADSNGRVTFKSIYPGCYSGRWPHIHFEVYRSAKAATNDGPIVRTSQLALPKKQSLAVYTKVDGYASSVDNLSQTSLATDNVFRDDKAIHQLAAMTGSVKAGYFRASLKVPITL